MLDIDFNKFEKTALFGFSKKSKKRKKKQESWKTKFASDLNIKVHEYNLMDQLSKGFTRMIARKGL